MSDRRVMFPISRGIAYGLLGGFVGAIVMGAIAYMMPINGEPFFVAAAMMMGVKGTMAVVGGWVMHLIAGLIIGAIFGTIVSQVKYLSASDLTRGLGFGALAGVIVWLVFFLPLMSMMLSKMGMTVSPMIVGGSFVAHIIFGLIMGGIVGALLPRNLPTLTRPQPQARTTAQQFRCNACGASFNSQSDLMEHAKKPHSIPAK